MADNGTRLLWLDFESTSLPVGNDFTDVHVLEVAAIVTTLDLTQLAGMSDVIKMTTPAYAVLKQNPFVVEMHTKNGLLRECVQSKDAITLAAAEASIIEELVAAGAKKGKVSIAGSGVAGFDFPLIKAKMPELASWLTYYSYDSGVLRRWVNVLAKREIIASVSYPASGPDSSHRALPDVEAALEEVQQFGGWLALALAKEDAVRG